MISSRSGLELLPVYCIRPLPLSYVRRDMGSLMYRCNNSGSSIDVPIFAWYIEGGGQRILVDTGASAEHMRTHCGLEADDINTFEHVLMTRIGLRPQDIDLVIQTHLMVEHCANTRRCSNARIVVQQAELEFALMPHPILAPYYSRDLFMGLSFEPVDGYSEVVPGIELLPVPGQSPGCQAVCINTEKGAAIITGMCTLEENYYPRAGQRETMPVVPPGIHLDAVQAFNSALRIKGMADVIVPVHEPGLVNIDRIP